MEIDFADYTMIHADASSGHKSCSWFFLSSRNGE